MYEISREPTQYLFIHSFVVDPSNVFTVVISALWFAGGLSRIS